MLRAAVFFFAAARMVDGDGFNFWFTQKRKGRHMNKTAEIGRETKKAGKLLEA
jgi:hypothetical protein